MRIAIVNDLMVEHLCRVVLSVPGYEVAWIARSGVEAVQKCSLDRPDLIIMDPDIPGLHGVEAIRQIMQKMPCPILIITPDVKGNAARVFEALGCGALDAVNTPLFGTHDRAKQSRAAFLKKIETIGKLRNAPPSRVQPRPKKRLISPHLIPSLVVIGASTGGPKTLVRVLSGLPAQFGAAIIVAQHLDQEFSDGLAEWLNAQTPMHVQIARQDERPDIRNVYVAGSNHHLIITPELTFAYTPEPRDNPYRPSVDVLFESLLAHWPGRGCAVLLTGMGRDGAAGLARLRKAGWHTIAQDQATSVVYGMPKAAKELDAADEILPLDEIGPAILNFKHLLNETPGFKPPISALNAESHES
jgi:two-component system, chemotaxis family, response regulator WspF